MAGGSGVLGRLLVPKLVANGHEVTASTTSRVMKSVLLILLEVDTEQPSNEIFEKQHCKKNGAENE